MSQLGRISGPLLKANLLRDGVNLAFETDLLYLDVINGRVGIKTAAPTHDLTVAGTTRTTNLEVTTQIDLATFTINNNTISSSSSTINLVPSGSNPIVYQAKLVVDNLQLATNTIQVTQTNSDLNITTTGTGQVNVNSNMLVSGNLHATGNITADGDILLGNAPTDTVTFNADIASNIVPDVTNSYTLGADPSTGGNAWSAAYIHDINTSTITLDTASINNINLVLPQGNIIYVATTGADTNGGVHEHNPFLTIKHALSVATSGTTVYIYPGTYSEIFPITVPAGVTVKGSGIRSVIIQPTLSTIDKDAFLLNGETTVEDLTITGFKFNSTNNTGYGLRLANNFRVYTRSPYIRNITIITRGTPTTLTVNAFKTQNNAGITRVKDIIDEIVVNTTITATSGNVTPQVKDVAHPSNSATGILLQGLIDNVLYIINNGAAPSVLPTITLNGSLTSDTDKLNAAALIASNVAFLKAEMVAYLAATYAGFWGTWSQTLAERDLGIILTAIQYDITHGGNEKSIAAGIGFWVNPSSDQYGFASNDAGKGVLLDGSVANSLSNEVTGLFHSVTFITPNQETITATNGVRIELLNSFTYFADKGIYVYSGSTGFAGAGVTRLKIPNRTGTWNVGNTLNYYATDSTTVLASGTIASIDGEYVNLTGKQLGFEALTDRAKKVIYANGNAKISTTQSKFGGSSLYLDGTADFLNVVTQPDFNFGSGDFTIELWVYRVGNPGTLQVLVDMRESTPAFSPVLYLSTNNQISYVVNGATVITGATIQPTTWTHIALVKHNNVTKIYFDGNQTGASYADTNTYIQGPVRIGARFDASTGFNGYIDDVRITKGVAKYTSSPFQVPSSALTSDTSTVLLLHFNGTNNSQTVLDDGLTLQDLRSSAGGTATNITFADYSDFGVEVRVIGSANVYGNYGVVGDGDGINVIIISHNFAYIGSGGDSTNNPTLRIGANEVVKLNRARINYTQIDNEGNFSVGEYFSVNQKTGDVTFNGSVANFALSNGLTFTDGIHTTIINAADITTGNIKIYNNNIDSLVGDIVVTAASGAINLQNSTFITGNLDVTGDVTIGGNITIGNQPSDTISFVAKVDSDIVPTTTNTYDLGTSLLTWKNTYLNRVEIDKLVIDNNTISTTNATDDLILTASTTGRIYIPSNDVQINNNLTVTNDFTVTTGTSYLKDVTIIGNITQSGNINQTGTLTTSGDTTVVGNITTTGYIQLPEILLSNNTISTYNPNTDLSIQSNGTGKVIVEDLQFKDNNITSVGTNTNIILTPQSTGSVIINSTQSLQIPVGTTSDRPTGANGMIRYNTTLSRYEGWNGTYWLKLSGVQDLDGTTYITAENTPGANDNVLRFYIDNSLRVTIDSDKLYTPTVKTDNITITSNTISSITTNSDLNFTTTGTGGVQLGNLKIRNNTITNVVPNAITEIVQAGTGYVKINGTEGMVIPFGTTSERPGNATLGMMRFNTDLDAIEIYNGSLWISGAGITFLNATDIGISSALLFG